MYIYIYQDGDSSNLEGRYAVFNLIPAPCESSIGAQLAVSATGNCAPDHNAPQILFFYINNGICYFIYLDSKMYTQCQVFSQPYVARPALNFVHSFFYY